MRVIVAGSRSITDPGQVAAGIEASGFDITELVSGAARGVDQLGESWAHAHGVPVRRFPAEWARYGRSAGPRRNAVMARYAAAAAEGRGGLVAVWDGVSPGTRHMIGLARQLGLAVYVYRITLTGAKTA